MNQKSSDFHEIDFLEVDRIFVVRLFGVPDEADVMRCFADYEGVVAEKYEQRSFGFVINVTEEAHSSLAVIRMIRQLLTSQTYRSCIRGMAAVNDDPIKVEARNAGPGASMMPFFNKEEEAIDYLRGRMGEAG